MVQSHKKNKKKNRDLVQRTNSGKSTHQHYSAKRKNVFSPINHCYKVAPYRIISLGEKRSRQKAEKTFALKWIERR